MSLEWVPSSGLLDQKVNAYLLLPDIVKFPSLAIVLFYILGAVYESVCFLTSLPTAHVVRLLGFCQSDR